MTPAQDAARELADRFYETCKTCCTDYARQIMTDDITAAFTQREADLRAQLASPWKPISSFDFSKMQFVLVAEDGAVRARLWNNHRNIWERADGFSEVQCGDECRNPEYWMEIPDPPASAKPEEKP